MKLPKEFLNGILIFIGIAIYFIITEILNLSYIHYLRVFNVIIVYYGVHRTLTANAVEGVNGFIPNLISAGLTALIGVFSSVIGLIIFIYSKGGDVYLNSLSELFLFGGKPHVAEYCFGILFEGIASAVMVVFISMLLWKSKNPEKN